MLLLFVLTLIPALIQASVFITQPTQGTVWQAGSQVSVNWEAANSTALNNSPIDFYLVYGSANAFQNIGKLVTAPSESAQQVTFVVPKTLPTGNQYAVRTGNAYSPYFQINNPEVQANSTFPVLTGVAPISSSATRSLSSGATMVVSIAAVLAYYQL